MPRWCQRALCVLLLLFLPAWFACARTQEETLRICVIDVGQSDCILLSAGGNHLLIDTGTASARDSVIATLAAMGVDRLDYLLITHPHEDHYGNARSVLETYPVDKLLLPQADSAEFAYALVSQTAQREGVSVQTVGDGMVFSLGNAACTLLLATGAEDLNNQSAVLRVAYGESVLLFAGDAEAQAEAMLCEQYAGFLDCDFLKVGHHGSRTATSEVLLRAATPRIAAISCGAENEYGFPHSEVLDRLTGCGAAFYRTDTAGTLLFECDGKEIVYKE